MQMAKDSHATFFENAAANGTTQKQAAASTNNTETDSSTNNLEALERRTLKTIFYAACAAIGAALLCMYLVAGAYNKSKPYPPTPGVVPLFMDAGQEMNNIGRSKDNNSGQEGEQGQGNKEYGLNEEDFTYSLFSCHSEPILSAFSCLCMPIRLADTLRMAGMLPFSCAVALFALLAAVPPVFIGAAVFYRYQMRKLFKLPTSCWTICKDCFFYSFCTCCSVVQEARQLEMAFRVRDAAIADVLAKNSDEIGDEATEMQAQPSQNKMSEPLAAGREDAGNDAQEGIAG
jgi:Cys-rich protein (TIGR01571 family)